MQSVEFQFSVAPSERDDCTWRFYIEAVFAKPLSDPNEFKLSELRIGDSAQEGAGDTSDWARDYWEYWANERSVGVYADVPQYSMTTGFQVDGRLSNDTDHKKTPVILDFEEGQPLFIETLRQCRESVKEALEAVYLNPSLCRIVFRYLGVATMAEKMRDCVEEGDQVEPTGDPVPLHMMRNDTET